MGVVGGYEHTDLLDLDPRIEVEKLPPFQLRPGAATNDVRPERRRLLLRHLSDWRPGVVLVDHYPEGLAGELLPVLRGDSTPAVDGLAKVPGCEVWQPESVDEAVANAAFVVCRAGYNTTFEVVANPVPVIFVPFQSGQPEQMEGARRLADLPGVWVVDESAPSADEDFRDAVAGAVLLSGLPVTRKLPFRTTGAAGAAALLWESARLTRSRLTSA